MSTNPRRAAFDILMRIERERSYADILIDRELSRHELQGPDRGLFTELVYGVLRRRGTLDYLTSLWCQQKPAKLEVPVQVLLRLGLYQLFFLDRVPVFAAVNETVNLAKEVAPRATGLVNAVLRRGDRERDHVAWPDRDKDLGRFLAVRYSQPAWLVELWLRELGPTEAEALAQAMAEPAPLTIRVNTLKISRDELMERLPAEGVKSVPTRFSPDGLVIDTPVPIASLPSFREGCFTVQDESSQLAALILAPLPGEALLDACAAPGGKATHLAQLMGNRGSILAGDSVGRKLRLIEESAARLGVTVITTRELDAARPLPPIPSGPFDRILIDAPCTGLGVIRRNPEGKWWKSPADIDERALLQKQILRNLAPLVKNGGTLLYSTCSTTFAENEAVIDDFLSEHGDFVLEDGRELFPEWRELFTSRGFFRSWPHRHGMDGFFAARLRKK